MGPKPLDVDFPGPLQAGGLGDTIDLASGYPDSRLQPLALLKRGMNEAARRPATFGRLPAEGHPALRSHFANQISGNTDSTHHDVLITAGGQAALSLLFRTLSLPGDVVLMESPTYLGAIAAARSAQLVPSPVPTDDGGIDIDHLARAVLTTGANVLYLQPRFHNPTGATLAPDRRPALMALAQQHGLIVIEDDWLYDFDDPGHAPAPLAANDPGGHVVYVRSLTKSVAPALRIGAVASTGVIARRLRSVSGVENFFVSPILQETALNVITRPSWNRHLKNLRAALAERRTICRQVLATSRSWTFSNNGGPLHCWVALPSDVSADSLRDAALREGVSIVSGRQWHPGDQADRHIRLSVAAVSSPQIVEGVKRLNQALGFCRSHNN